MRLIALFAILWPLAAFLCWQGYQDACLYFATRPEPFVREVMVDVPAFNLWFIWALWAFIGPIAVAIVKFKERR